MTTLHAHALRLRLTKAIARWDAHNKSPHAGALALLRMDEALEAHAAGAPLRDALRERFNDRLLAALERAAGADLVPTLAGMAPDIAGMLRRKAAAPLKPTKPTLPCDIGLFSDDAKALDLVDLARAAGPNE